MLDSGTIVVCMNDSSSNTLGKLTFGNKYQRL